MSSRGFLLFPDFLPDLDSIKDLKEIDFEQSVPKHSLLLLHWFANVIDISELNVITLSFDPNREDFGSHHYGNYEDMLDPPPRGYKYYTVGNLNKYKSHDLPVYVLYPPIREYEGANLGRIIFSAKEANSGVYRVSRVYLTQHVCEESRYDPEHTYRISTNLLLQIRMLSVPIFQSLISLLFHNDIEDSWGEELTCLGLLLFILKQKRYTKDIRQAHKVLDSAEQAVAPPTQVMPTPTPGSLENGSNDTDQPEANLLNELNHPEQDGRQNETTADANFDQTNDHLQDIKQHVINENVKKCTGWLTLVLFLAVLLRLSVIVQFCSTRTSHEHPGRVAITSYNAHLELVVKHQKACARLYVNEDFRNWRTQFEQSWVGLYKSADEDTDQYEWGQWQWATKFRKCESSVDYDGYCFEYCSNMAAAPGVQARFMLQRNGEKARTPSLYSPAGVQITGYNLYLELFETDRKVCARLYVDKSLTEWTTEFAYSWVGFYASPERGRDEHERWQWVIQFKQFDNYWDFTVFEYCSDMMATSGVHARFIHSDMEQSFSLY